MLSLFCSRDYLKITNEKNQIFGRGEYCGQQTGQVLVTGKYALLKFHSDSTIQKKGFAMNFTAVPQGKNDEGGQKVSPYVSRKVFTL